MTIKFQQKIDYDGIWYIVSVDDFSAMVTINQQKAKDYYLKLVSDGKQALPSITTIEETTINRE